MPAAGVRGGAGVSAKWTIATLKQHFEALRKADQRALELQARELKRRLKILNGEHATLAQMKDTYVPREVYDRDMERARENEQTSATAQAAALREAGIAATANRRTMVYALVGVAIALVGWAITILFHFIPEAHP